jgi:hypothetical protein
MKRETLLPSTQEFATCPCSEQIISAHTPICFMKVHYNIAFPSTPRSSAWSLSITFPYQNLLFTSVFYIFHKTRPFILPYVINLIVLHEGYRSWSSSLCSLHHPLLPRPSISSWRPFRIGRVLPKYFKLPNFKMNFLTLCCTTFLYCGPATWTYTKFSLHLLLDHSP